MKRLLAPILLLALAGCGNPEPGAAVPEAGVAAAPAPNTLTEAERAAGWRLLFDGATTAGWRGAYRDTMPANWTVEDGALATLGVGAGDGGGSIMTEEEFSSFELKLEFKIEAGANSGVKYLLLPERDPPTPGRGLGLEYQIWDNDQPRQANHTLGALYDLIEPEGVAMRPVGAYNEARIVVRGDSVEHWLNGARVVAYNRRSPAFRALVAGSKYRDLPDFGLVTRGRILLQDEGGPGVSFRNIKLREV